jgi:hypothetical protein
MVSVIPSDGNQRNGCFRDKLFSEQSYRRVKSVDTAGVAAAARAESVRRPRVIYFEQDVLLVHRRIGNGDVG